MKIQHIHFIFGLCFVWQFDSKKFYHKSLPQLNLNNENEEKVYLVCLRKKYDIYFMNCTPTNLTVPSSTTTNITLPYSTQKNFTLLTKISANFILPNSTYRNVTLANNTINETFLHVSFNKKPLEVLRKHHFKRLSKNKKTILPNTAKKTKNKLDVKVTADQEQNSKNVLSRKIFGTFDGITSTSSLLSMNTAAKLEIPTGQKEETFEDYYSSDHGDHMLKLHKSSTKDKLETPIQSSEVDIYPLEINILSSKVGIQPSEVNDLQSIQSILFFSSKPITNNKLQATSLATSAILSTPFIRPYSTIMPTIFTQSYFITDINNGVLYNNSIKSTTLNISNSVQFNHEKQKKNSLSSAIILMTPTSDVRHTSAIIDKTFARLNSSKQIETIIRQSFIQATSTIILNQTKKPDEQARFQQHLAGKNFLVKFEILRLFTHPLYTKSSEAYQLLKKRTEKAVSELYNGYEEFKGCKVVGMNRVKKDNMTSVEMEIYFTERGGSHLKPLQQQLATGKLGDKQTEKEIEIALLNDGITDINWCLPPCLNAYQCYPNCEKKCCELSKFKINFNRQLDTNQYNWHPAVNPYSRYPTINPFVYSTKNSFDRYIVEKQNAGYPTIKPYGGYPSINSFLKYSDMTINNLPTSIQLQKNEYEKLPYSSTNVEDNNFNSKKLNPVYVIYKYIPINVDGSVYPINKYETNVAGSMYPNDKYQSSLEMENQPMFCDPLCKYKCLPACHKICCTTK
ncbi:uncharacterized protein LOC100214223 isoform X1 [Hydra vulgaris]|uniref:uncharacterized protein LOC100214223 isoform X1 n=2 Tax=Hydra vulgaris TaxID=6087 RepID=UPI001F5EEC1E|nr:uncharacterized protein LOC100214223 isoform X2 [Hydra vulgaris]